MGFCRSQGVSMQKKITLVLMMAVLPFSAIVLEIVSVNGIMSSDSAIEDGVFLTHLYKARDSALRVRTLCTSQKDIEYCDIYESPLDGHFLVLKAGGVFYCLFCTGAVQRFNGEMAFHRGVSGRYVKRIFSR